MDISPIARVCFFSSVIQNFLSILDMICLIFLAISLYILYNYINISNVGMAVRGVHEERRIRMSFKRNWDIVYSMIFLRIYIFCRIAFLYWMIENITVVTGAVFIVATFEGILWGFKTNINVKKIQNLCTEMTKTKILL